MLAGQVEAARGCVRREKSETQFRANPLEAALVGDIGVGTGQTRQVQDDGDGAVFGCGRQIETERHVRAGFRGLVGPDLLAAAEAAVLGFEFHGLTVLV